MDAIPRFTESDIAAIKEAKEALHRIDCWAVTCPTCPLYVGKRCIVNYLAYIATKAEQERGIYHDT